jgi:hypothetical protein
MPHDWVQMFKPPTKLIFNFYEQIVIWVLHSITLRVLQYLHSFYMHTYPLVVFTRLNPYSVLTQSLDYKVLLKHRILKNHTIYRYFYFMYIYRLIT